MKAVLLARVSTDEQDTAAQVSKLKDYANSHGLDYSQEDIFDFHESAYKSKRELFNEVIKYIVLQKEKIALVVDKVDRLMRNFMHIVPILELLEEDKIVLHFSSENLVIDKYSPATEKFKFNLGGMLAQYYSDAISDNVKRTIDEKVRRGKILTKAPFGYRNVTLDEEAKIKSVVVEPIEAIVVSKLFELYSTQAYSINQLSNKIKDEYNIKLGKSMIARILGDKFYIGIAKYKKKGIEYKHIYETIVSEHLFNQVQDIKEGRTKWNGKEKYQGKEFLYRAMIKCSICGYTLSPEEQRGKNYYRCTQYGGKHDAKYISEVKLKEQFAQAFKAIKLDKDTAEKVLTDLKALNETNSSISETLLRSLLVDREKIKKRLSKLVDEKLDESITKELYETKSKEYNKQLVAIQTKLNNVQDVDKSFYVTANLIVELANHSEELFRRSEPEEAQLLIKTVLQNVTWDGKNLHYDYTEPFNLLANLKDSTVWGG